MPDLKEEKCDERGNADKRLLAPSGVYYRGGNPPHSEQRPMAGNSISGGGAATHAGTNYQIYVAAWVAVQILAEHDVAPPWALPATVTLEALHAEAPGPIDDLTVLTS